MSYYLIDPHARTVTQVEWDKSIDQAAALIECESCDTARIAYGTYLMVDDIGHFQPAQAYFRLPGLYGCSLAGRALVFGADEGGETIEPRVSLEALRSAVEWVEGTPSDAVQTPTVTAYQSVDELFDAFFGK